MRRDWMREGWGTGLLAAGAGLALVLGQGCRRPPPPPQTGGAVKAPVPRTATKPLDEPLPIDESTPVGGTARQFRPRQAVVEPAPAPIERQQGVAGVTGAAQQRRQDARLEQRQEAASQRQQQELNSDVERSVRIQQEQQSEPRIQDAPGPSETGAAPGTFGQPLQPGQEPPRIQDAPGPAQTLPPQPTAPSQPYAPPVQEAPGSSQAPAQPSQPHD